MHFLLPKVISLKLPSMGHCPLTLPRFAAALSGYAEIPRPNRCAVGLLFFLRFALGLRWDCRPKPCLGRRPNPRKGHCPIDGNLKKSP